MHVYNKRLAPFLRVEYVRKVKTPSLKPQTEILTSNAHPSLNGPIMYRAVQFTYFHESIPLLYVSSVATPF